MVGCYSRFVLATQIALLNTGTRDCDFLIVLAILSSERPSAITMHSLSVLQHATTTHSPCSTVSWTIHNDIGSTSLRHTPAPFKCMRTSADATGRARDDTPRRI